MLVRFCSKRPSLCIRFNLCILLMCLCCNLASLCGCFLFHCVNFVCLFVVIWSIVPVCVFVVLLLLSVSLLVVGIVVVLVTFYAWWSLYVSPVIGWYPVQDWPCHSTNVSWNRLRLFVRHNRLIPVIIWEKASAPWKGVEEEKIVLSWSYNQNVSGSRFFFFF